MHLGRSVDKLSREGNDFGDDQLGDRSRVGEGRVEDRDTLFGGMGQVDLVGTDTETPDYDQLKVSRYIGGKVVTYVGTGVNNLGGDLGLRPETDTVILGEVLDQLVLAESPGLVVDLIYMSAIWS
jgi:hypothetical protein